MANIKDSLAKIMNLDGALGSCVVDSNSGMTLGAIGGGGSVDLEIAAAGNTEVVRAKRKTMKALNLNDQIEDMLITLGKAYHLIRPLASNDALFIYLVLEHAEDPLQQTRAVQLFSELAEQAGEAERELFAGFLDYAVRHQQVIQRFGRFPHRNEILGRVSRADELRFLAEPGSRF